MKKIALTSIVATCVAVPAFAESFPADELMLENKTYDNAATYDNMGLYSGDIDAYGEYDNCPAGSYCDSTGQHSCPSGYPNSAMGASASTECYTACTVASANIAHATAVSGNDYNGGTDTCSATACENGYHTQVVPANLYSIIGTRIGTAYAATNNTGANYEFFGGDNLVSIDTFGMSGPMVFAVDYGSRGVIRGRARCSTRSGNPNTWVGEGYHILEDNFVDTLTDETGQSGAYYCYCQLDSYTPANGDIQELTGPWVLANEIQDSTPGQEAAGCASGCAFSCAGELFGDDAYYYLPYREALLGAVSGGGLNGCAANTITINWSDVDGEDNPYATSVTYDGDITTPVKAATKPGKTFVGWKFEPPMEF